MSSLFIVSPSGIEALVVHTKALAADDHQRASLVKRLQERLQPIGSRLNWAPRKNPLPSNLVILAAHNPPSGFWRAVADTLCIDLHIEVKYVEANEEQWTRCEALVTIDDTLFVASQVQQALFTTLLRNGE